MCNLLLRYITCIGIHTKHIDQTLRPPPPGPISILSPFPYSLLPQFQSIEVQSIINMRSYKVTSALTLLACSSVSTAGTGPIEHQIQADRRTPNSTNSTNSTNIIFGSNGTITLRGNSSSPGVVLLDYGADVEGFPTFEIVSLSGDTSELQICYSETKHVIEEHSSVCIIQLPGVLTSLM